MTRGSRRRLSGVTYDPATDTTSVDRAGGKPVESHKYRAHYASLGSQPTATNDYGSHSGTGTNGRYSGRGRKNDYRCWKNYTHGKQYEKLPGPWAEDDEEASGD